MADTRQFILKVVADVKDATAGMKQVEDSSSTMKDKVTGIGKAVVTGLAVGAVVNFGKESVQAAADAEQAMNGVREVFGTSADEIEEYSSKAIKNMGISDDAYQAFATTTGGLLQDMGVPLDDTVKMTDDLAQRGADLAAVYGVDAEQAFGAMQKALGGSTKGLKALGIDINKNEIEARALSEGWVDAEGNVTKAGKAMATQALIMEKSADKAGAFAEHSDEVANQQKILALQFEETKETIGNALLPIISKLMGALVPLLDFTMKYADVIVPIAGVIAGIVLAYKAYEIAMMASKVAMGIATAAQWAWNAAMSANPIGLIVIAITAVIGAVVLLYKKVGWFRAGVDAAVDGVVAAFNWVLDKVKAVFNWIKKNWPLLLAIIAGPFGLAVLAIKKNWNKIVDAVKAAFEFIKRTMGKVKDIVVAPFKAAMEIIKNVWHNLVDFVRNIPARLGAVLTSIWRFVSSPFRDAFNAVKDIIGNMVDWFRNLPDRIGNAVRSVWRTMSQPFKDGKDAVIEALQAIGDWFRDLPGNIGDWLSGIADIITSPFTSAFEAIRNFWNDTVGGFGFSIPSWVPGVGGKSFEIPSMAAGGIVNRPTIALIGEAGPEAVVPLGRAGLGTTVINVYALTAGPEVGRQVYNALREYERATGKAIA